MTIFLTQVVLTSKDAMMAAIGGAMIGISVLLMFWLFGKITGISGIFGGVITFSDIDWKLPFLLGIVAGGFLLRYFYPQAFPSITRGWPLMLAAGFLVGLGTKWGNGCTSGHGICGLARLSLRSIVAVLSFIIFGMLTTYVYYHVLGKPMP